MNLRSFFLYSIPALFLAGCATTPPVPHRADAYSYPLERAVEARQDRFVEGWNLVCQTETGEYIYADVNGGVITGWEVREADGMPVPTEVRPASPYNDSMLRLWWQPTVGSSRFVEAPSWIIQP